MSRHCGGSLDLRCWYDDDLCHCLLDVECQAFIDAYYCGDLFTSLGSCPCLASSSVLIATEEHLGFLIHQNNLCYRLKNCDFVILLHFIDHQDASSSLCS